MFVLLLLTACSKDIDETVTVDAPKGVATVTFLVTPNGLGDNGYNDAAAEGIFAFAGETGTRLRLLLPGDEAVAETMYRQWLTDNAVQDSAVMILGSAAYEAMARQVSATDSDKLKSLQERGGRVLLFESDAAIDGVSTVLVSHYGVSWLAGAMSQGFDALILAATEGIPALEESIAGFQAAREAYAGKYEGWPCTTDVHYLADGEAGFAMPDSTYRYIARRAEESGIYDEMIFPLIGVSETGVLRYLNDWLNGREWPQNQRLGIKDGAADIVVTPEFIEHLTIWDGRYSDPETFRRLYEKYKDEAMRKEEAYEK